mgnify:CR=1 FL=1
MIGLILGETQFGYLIIKKLRLYKKNFIILDISEKNIYRKYTNSYNLSLGQLGKAISLLKKNKCRKIIFAGKVKKPNIKKIKFDVKALYYLPKIIKSIKKSDATIIKLIIDIFKKEGLKVLKSTHFNPELLLRKGSHTKIKPDLISKRDILKAKNIITDLKRRRRKDIGQAVVIKNGHLVAIESSNGTDAMLSRAKILIKRFRFGKKRQGILLKFPKPNQDLRVDLPTVGINTITKCSRIGLKGVVVKANQNIFLDKKKCIKLANKKRMFITAI